MARLTDTALRETICDRFLAVADATGMTRGEFGQMCGLSSQQMSHIASYRTLPSHAMIFRVAQHYNIPTDFFYGRTEFGLTMVAPKTSLPLGKQARAA